MDKTAVVKAALLWLDANDIRIPADILCALPAKTYSHYSRQIAKAVEDLFRGKITKSDFVGYMAEIISVQIPKAWAEGMRENDLEYPDEMIPEWQQQVDGIILSEYNYVDGFADAIVSARMDKQALPGLLSRGELWANRYNDVVNQSVLATADGKTKMVWILGDTENSCETCPALDGIVAFAREWEQARFRPQQPPNDTIGCSGWNCHCQLIPTTQRRTRNALDYLLSLAVRV